MLSTEIEAIGRELTPAAGKAIRLPAAARNRLALCLGAAIHRAQDLEDLADPVYPANWPPSEAITDAFLCLRRLPARNAKLPHGEAVKLSHRLLMAARELRALETACTLYVRETYADDPKVTAFPLDRLRFGRTLTLKGGGDAA